ncbi:family 10 glycosylhydrolase [Roseisolibacter sp. H3M3-2]|uniref:glycoside hydrolase family 10 protein n=1 Tax=Roseisolibacter sp. H3M3-2 TaxID=3031323 RepID=UPI0023DADD87|nr:family 10 glycosylhydrolase [Roseisolibacter sp. H3M3-2]MDF1502106.1 family 10 glycosylhydrolase [Roseisolibacter sp. H3M3-2]
MLLRPLLAALVPFAVTSAARPAAPAAAPQCPVLLDASALEAPPALPREFRAAWITPVDGGEWPSRPGMTDEESQAELRGAIQRAADVGLNAVVLHVRTAHDALYPTSRVPWSSYLVPPGGRAPGFDPLAFALSEAHRRGLQVHVWFNPFRAAPPNRSRTAVGAQQVARAHPDWLVRYGSQQWIDPGFPAARREVLDAILEVVDRYDVDGVHLDDYFYPYQETRTIRTRVGKGKRRRTVTRTETIAFDDADSWARHGRGTGMARDAWRRENVSQFIAALYREVKARRPEVAVGISPFGIWRPGAAPGVYGLDAYSEIYADSRRWLREGWLDYLAPQLYWQLDGEQLRFRRLDAWWRQENVRQRHVFPGLLTMRVGSRGAAWSPSAITDQIAWLREQRAPVTEAAGHVHFRMSTLMPSAQGALGDRLAQSLYATTALPPANPWLGAQAPAAPDVTPACDAAPGDGGAAPAPALAVIPGDSLRVRWWAVQLRDSLGGWRTRVVPGAERRVSAELVPGTTAHAVAVSALSPTGVAGPSRMVRLR